MTKYFEYLEEQNQAEKEKPKQQKYRSYREMLNDYEEEIK